MKLFRQYMHGIWPCSSRKQGTDRARKCGLTLVEIVVYMSLALFVMGGIMGVVTRAQRLTHASEERFAAFIYCKTQLELLRYQDLSKLNEHGYTYSSGTWQRVRASVAFHTKSNPARSELTGTETITLREATTASDIRYHQVEIKLEWDARSSSGRTLTESIATDLY